MSNNPFAFDVRGPVAILVTTIVGGLACAIRTPGPWCGAPRPEVGHRGPKDIERAPLAHAARLSSLRNPDPPEPKGEPGEFDLVLVGQDGKPLDGVTAIVSPSEGAVDVASWPLHLPAGTLGVVFCVEVGRLDSCMVLGPSDLTPVVTFEPELASYHPTDRPVWCGVGVSSTPDGAMDIAGGTPRTECGLELTGLSPTGYCVLDPVAYEGMNPMQVLRGIVESGHPVVCQPGGSGAMGLRAPRDGEATKTVSGRLQVTP